MSPPFLYTRRVEFGETDLAGIMHFSNFFRFMEAAECEFLRSRGLTVSWVENGVKHGFPRVSASCDFRAPARVEDVLSIELFVEAVGQKSITYRHEFRRGDEPLATGRITCVYVRAVPGGMESLPLTDDQRRKLTG
jgi:YbgC/YbaW family acyl-CoA thioester hydrolase